MEQQAAIAMDSFFGKMKAAAEHVEHAAANAVHEYLPAIATQLREKAGPAIVEFIEDPEIITEVARAIYELMPMPVRLVIKEEVFTKAVLRNKEKLFATVHAQLANETAATDQPASVIAPTQDDQPISEHGEEQSLLTATADNPPCAAESPSA